MSEDSGTRKKRRASNEYQTPESISVEIVDPVTIEEDGKPQYTTYKIITEVCSILSSFAMWFALHVLVLVVFAAQGVGIELLVSSKPPFPSFCLLSASCA